MSQALFSVDDKSDHALLKQWETSTTGALGHMALDELLKRFIMRFAAMSTGSEGEPRTDTERLDWLQGRVTTRYVGGPISGPMLFEASVAYHFSGNWKGGVTFCQAIDAAMDAEESEA